MKRTLLMVSIILALLVACGASSQAQDTRQRYFLNPPYKGQSSQFSDWVINPAYWNELTNCYIDETGIIQQRPAVFCWLDSVSTSKPILGAIDYRRWVEGGAKNYLVFNTNNNVYYTTPYYGNTNTDITPNISNLSNDGIPVWAVFYNDLFMANGEDNPLQWDMDGNCIQLGRCVFAGTVTFEDDNEIVSATNFESGNYHFRPGWDIIITDSNNNDTYEIYSVDSNVMVVTTTAGAAVDWTYDESDSVTLTGVGFPSDLTVSTRTETATLTHDFCQFIANVSGYGSGVSMYGVNPVALGFKSGMTLTVSGSSSNDGSYTINDVIYAQHQSGNWGLITITTTFTAELWGETGTTVTFNGTHTITSTDSFNPGALAGHKGRLFAGGVKEYPTRLYYSISRLLSTQGTFYYDMWRDRHGYTDGSGYFDVQDKVVALVGEWNGMLIVFCESSILKIIGDDPGFDILTPSQAIVYQPVPISKKIGCVGPNAWCEVGNDIFFMSKAGLQQLSIVEGGDLPRAVVRSLPISDIIDDIVKIGEYKKISMKFLPYLNLILISCDIADNTDNVILAYNVVNQSWSKWTFASGSDPKCLFEATGALLDPNISGLTHMPYEPDPHETMWFGSDDGKLFAFTRAACYDRDCEGTCSQSNYGMTAISGKLNFGEPFLEKNFRRAVIMASPQINYSTSSGGAVSLYFKVDDGSWSSAVSKSFTTHSDTAATPIDYFEYLDAGVSMGSLTPKMGKTIQLKLYTSGTTSRFGLSFLGAMMEWEPIRY